MLRPGRRTTSLCSQRVPHRSCLKHLEATHPIVGQMCLHVMVRSRQVRSTPGLCSGGDCYRAAIATEHLLSAPSFKVEVKGILSIAARRAAAAWLRSPHPTTRLSDPPPDGREVTPVEAL